MGDIGWGIEECILKDSSHVNQGYESFFSLEFLIFLDMLRSEEHTSELQSRP